VGGVVSNVLSGLATGRRFERVREVILAVAKDLKELESSIREDYVKSDEFEDLLTETLERVYRERNEEKRQLFRCFLVKSATTTEESYDERLRFLRDLEELQYDHIRMLEAVLKYPFTVPGVDPDDLPPVSIDEILNLRLRGMDKERVRDLADELTMRRIARLDSTDSVIGDDLRDRLTPYGDRLCKFIIKGHGL
jgi:pyruvate-formate lyase-activating enzyme